MSLLPTDEKDVNSLVPRKVEMLGPEHEEEAPPEDWKVPDRIIDDTSSSGTMTPPTSPSASSSPRSQPQGPDSGIIDSTSPPSLPTAPSHAGRRAENPDGTIPPSYIPPVDLPPISTATLQQDPIDKPEPTPTPATDEKMEDEDATKPPVEELPPFAYDAYESDEEDFFAKIPHSYSETLDEVKRRMRPDAVEEKRYYETLVGSLETYLLAAGVSPPQMPYGPITSILRLDQLRAIARVLKDERLCANVTSFEAVSGDHWRNLTGLGLKWILNGLHNNKSISTLKISQVAWSREDGERFVRCLSRSPHVTTVNFESMTAQGDAALRVLLREMPSNKTVRDLSLRATTFSETSFTMLLAVVAENTTLEKLNLRHCDFSYHNRAQRLMQALIDNPNTKLVEIGWPLMRGAVLFMAQMLQYNKTISAIDLSNISLGPHVTLLQRALGANTSLKSLNISNTSITDAHLAVLLQPLWTNDSLTELDISHNLNLTGESAKNLGDLLMQNVGLESLNVGRVSANMAKDRLAKYIGRALKTNSTLRKLYLSQSNTESAGAVFIGEALAVNHGLQLLDLSLNPGFDDSALAALLKHISSNHGLQSLNVSTCKLGDGVSKVLVPWLSTTQVLTVLLDIGQNKISQNVLVTVAETIRANPALRSTTYRPIVSGVSKATSPRGKH